MQFTPKYSYAGSQWKPGHTLEVIAGVTSPLQIDFFSCTTAHSATMYIVTSMLYVHIKLFISKNQLLVGVNKYFCYLIHVRVI